MGWIGCLAILAGVRIAFPFHRSTSQDDGRQLILREHLSAACSRVDEAQFTAGRTSAKGSERAGLIPFTALSYVLARKSG